MNVQAINAGGFTDADFDIYTPGGGVGDLNGCASQCYIRLAMQFSSFQSAGRLPLAVGMGRRRCQYVAIIL